MAAGKLFAELADLEFDRVMRKIQDKRLIPLFQEKDLWVGDFEVLGEGETAVIREILCRLWEIEEESSIKIREISSNE